MKRARAISRRNLLKILAGISVAAIGVGSFKILERLWGHDKEMLEEEVVVEEAEVEEEVEVEKEVEEELKVEETINLPEPKKKGNISIEEAIENRRSRRSYTDEPILLSDISQLCWAAQGITERRMGFRASPSAGALYPLEVFLVVGNSDLEAGVYHYSCKEHVLERIKNGDYRKQLSEGSLGQDPVEKGALDFVITAIYDRTTRKYGERGRERYVQMEAGHVAENIYLQAESLGLGTVSIGAFYDDDVREAISSPSDYIPLYVMPIGHVQ